MTNSKIIYLKFFFILVSCWASVAMAQSPQESIQLIMGKQTAAWNRGDIPAFMEGYWKSDSLQFVGQSGVTYGWQKTLDNYKKHYPDTANMGQLTFDILEIKPLSKDYCYVLGKWFLKRSVGDVGGHFTLLFKKFKDGWKIVADHSS